MNNCISFNMKAIFTILGLAVVSLCSAQTNLKPSQVDFDGYISLAKEVQQYRKNRVIHLKKWLKMSKEPKTIILDTRSKAMYDRKHIQGAVHLNFSDFTMESLYRIAPDKNTRILIYCNNNISNENVAFISKMYIPPTPTETKRLLALNVPTFINLYGYGYKNIYELADLVDYKSGQLSFEGSSIRRK